MGRVAAVTQRITGAVSKGMTSVGLLLIWPIYRPASKQAENSGLPAEVHFAKEDRPEAPKRAASVPPPAAPVQTRTPGPQAVPKANPVQAGQPSGAPRPAQVSPGAQAAAKSEPASAVAVLEAEEQPSPSPEEEPPPPSSPKGSMSSPAPVTRAQVQRAVFDRASDKILLAKAVSDIASRDTAVRLDAVQHMADIKHVLSVQALHANLVSDTSAQVRQACVKALTALEMREGLGALEQALSDGEASVRLAAVWGLYRLAGAASAPTLLRMLSDSSEGVRQRSATCIGWLGREEHAGKLKPLLNDSRALVRRAAAEALGLIGHRGLVLALIDHLKDPDKAVRLSILGSIEKITGEGVGGEVPQNEADLDRLIARLRQWWKEELAQ